jgi:hypothetical protein
VDADFPEGWDLDRVRARLPGAVLLDPHEHYVVEASAHPPGKSDYYEVTPTLIIMERAEGGLCLVRDGMDGQFLMGQFNQSDHSIVCFGTYGPDLGQAIEAM